MYRNSHGGPTLHSIWQTAYKILVEEMPDLWVFRLKVSAPDESLQWAGLLIQTKQPLQRFKLDLHIYSGAAGMARDFFLIFFLTIADSDPLGTLGV